MDRNQRTDFLKPKDIDREPNNIDFANPEVINWGEIDPELRIEMIDSFNRSLDKNKGNLSMVQKIIRMASVIGILTGGLYIDKKFNDSEITNKAEDIAASIPERLMQATETTISPEAKEAIEQMEENQEQKEREKYLEEQARIEAAEERERFSIPTNDETLTQP